MINSFSEINSFFSSLADMNTLNCKNECFTIMILINSFCDTRIENYKIDLNELEKQFDDVLEFLYNRLALAKLLEWRFKYDTLLIIIKKTRKLFNKLYNFIFDFNRHNVKY